MDAALCTTTLIRSDGWNLSPTRTMYVWTTTKVATTDCHGCAYLIETTPGGVGPGM